MTTSDNPLARAARARRASLNLSQGDVHAASGLSVTTIAKIEVGDPTVSPTSLRRYDAAVGWAEGTAESWRDGMGPAPIPPQDELVRWAEQLAPVVAAQLRAAEDANPWAAQLAPIVAAHLRATGSLSVVGLPAPIVAAIEALVVAIRAHCGST